MDQKENSSGEDAEPRQVTSGNELALTSYSTATVEGILKGELATIFHGEVSTIPPSTGNENSAVSIEASQFHSATIGGRVMHNTKNETLANASFKGAHFGNKVYNIFQGDKGASTPKQHEKLQESKNEDHVDLSDTIRVFTQDLLYKAPHVKVYRGEQRSDIIVRQIAVKMTQYNKQNQKEAQILMKLSQHQNVVSIIHADVFQESRLSKMMFIAMELCHSQNLRAYLLECDQCNRPIDGPERISMAKQVVSALSFIHESNIVHGDMKPDNILFSLDMKLLKISDFGLSKELRHGRSVTKSSIIGTDGYRAPETYIRNKINRKADIYSLGLVTFAIWTNGKHPFGENDYEWTTNIMKNENFDISQLLLSEHGAEEVIIWMLKYIPEERPTAQQVLTHSIFGVQTTKDTPEASKSVQRYNQTEANTKKIDTVDKRDNAHPNKEESDSIKRDRPESAPLPAYNKDSFRKDGSLRNTRARFKRLKISPGKKDSKGLSKESGSEIIFFDRRSMDLKFYEPFARRWTRPLDLHEGFDKGFTTVVIESYLYILSPNKSVFRLNCDREKTKWKQMASMKAEHGIWAPAAYLKGCIYVGSGIIAKPANFEKYEAKTNIWSTLWTARTMKDSVCLVAAQDKYIYCIGGCDMDGKASHCVERYELSTGCWDDPAWPPRAIRDATGVEHNEKVYVADHEGVLYLNTLINAWRRLDLDHCWPFRTAFGVKIVIVDGKLHLIGFTKDGSLTMFSVDQSHRNLCGVGTVRDNGFISVCNCIVMESRRVKDNPLFEVKV